MGLLPITQNMYLLSLFLVLACGLSATMADRTRTEWEEGINTLLAALEEARNENNFTAFAAYITEDFEGFRPGKVEALTVTDLKTIGGSFRYELVNLRWFCGNGAVIAYTIRRAMDDVQHIVSQKLLALVIDEEGTLKISTAEMNYIY